jgi:REP element-mobilizing transposase RayT
MLVEAVDRKELSAMVRTLKAVSAKELHATPRFRVGNIQGYHPDGSVGVEGRESFWATRYGWREIDEKEVEDIRDYIKNQKRIPHTPA